MGMKNTGKKKEIVKRSRPTDAELNKIDENNGAAGEIISGLTAGHKVINYESRDIPLYDIRLNSDNALFRQSDTDDDIVQLAKDIQRNGLMHNLVLFPKEEEGRTVYVLLSGERRYRAMVYLEKQGDASWNIVNSCRVITSDLSDNEKKVLLYSANLQVRGGLADEQIRRKAIGEFVACLQKEPYNMTEADAKKALKDISATSAKQIDRDFRIEENLDKDLLALLNARLLMRIECEQYIQFEPDVQHRIAEHYKKLFSVDCGSKEDEGYNRFAEEKNSIHYDFIKAIDEVKKISDPDERDEKLNAAFAENDTSITELEKAIGEYRAAIADADREKASAVEKDIALAQEDKRVEKKQKAARGESPVQQGATFVEKTVQVTTEKISKKLASANYKRGIKKMTQERRDDDIALLNDLIEKAQALKEMIETAK